MNVIEVKDLQDLNAKTNSLNSEIKQNIESVSLDLRIYSFKGNIKMSSIKELTDIMKNALFLYDFSRLEITLPYEPRSFRDKGSFDGCGSLYSAPKMIYNVTDFSYFYRSCSNLTSAKTEFAKDAMDCGGMFCHCPHLKEVDTSPMVNCQLANSLFEECHSLEKINISTMKNLKDITSIFSRCENLKEIILPPRMPNLKYMSWAFSRTGIKQMGYTGCFSSVKSAKSAFSWCNDLESINMEGFKALKEANDMFDHCPSLIRVIGCTLPKLTSATRMFNYCSQLRHIDDAAFPALMWANYMFHECSALEELITILPSFGHCEDLEGVFCGCLNLSKISSTIDFSKATIIKNSFYNCRSLTSLDQLKSMIDVRITEGAFLGTSLEEVDLRSMKKVVDIGADMNWISPPHRTLMPRLVNFDGFSPDIEIPRISLDCQRKDAEMVFATNLDMVHFFKTYKMIGNQVIAYSNEIQVPKELFKFFIKELPENKSFCPYYVNLKDIEYNDLNNIKNAVIAAKVYVDLSGSLVKYPSKEKELEFADSIRNSYLVAAPNDMIVIGGHGGNCLFRNSSEVQEEFQLEGCLPKSEG